MISDQSGEWSRGFVAGICFVADFVRGNVFISECSRI